MITPCVRCGRKVSDVDINEDGACVLCVNSQRREEAKLLWRANHAPPIRATRWTDTHFEVFIQSEGSWHRIEQDDLTNVDVQEMQANAVALMIDRDAEYQHEQGDHDG